MRPFVSRFTLLLGLLLILTGILLSIEDKATLAWIFIPVGIITFVISFFNVFRRNPEHEAGVFMEPGVEEFEDNADDESLSQEKEK